MFRITMAEQGTEEWKMERLGRVTASVFSQVITSTGKLSASAETIINRAVAEIILNTPDETFESEAMLRGRELEEDALNFFNFTYGMNLEKVGFLVAQDLDGNDQYYGCSPDALDLSSRMGAEFKCPLAHTHLAYLVAGDLPKAYKQQVQGALCVTGLDQWFFGSYHPDLPAFGVVIERDEKFIMAIKEILQYCHEEITARVAKTRDIMQGKVA